MLIVLSLACSAAVVFSWKNWAGGFPRTYLWGRAGCCFSWSNAGSFKPAFPPAPCRYLSAPHCGALWEISQRVCSRAQVDWNQPSQGGSFLARAASGLWSAWAGTRQVMGIAAGVGRGQNHSSTAQGCYSPPVCEAMSGIWVLFHPSPAILMVSGDVPPCPIGSCPFLAHQPYCQHFTVPFLV